MAGVIFRDIFLDDAMTTICGCSGDIRTCLCGRTTFNSEYQQGGKGEPTLEELRSKVETEPDKFLEVDYSVPSMHLHYGEKSGDVVIGCSCELAIKIARQWLASRHQIKALLRLCAEELDRMAKEHQGVVDAIGSDMKKLERSK